MVIKRGQSQPLSLKQLFEANFAPRGHLAKSGDGFWLSKLKGATGISWVKTKDATLHRVAPTAKDDLDPKYP